MQTLVFTASCMFGIAIGWLVVYFIRKYKAYSGANLAKTASVFMSGCVICSATRFVSSEIWLVSLTAYLIGVTCGFFLHWFYQWYAVKKADPKFMSPRSRYNLFAGCNLSEEYEDRTLFEYKLECINSGFKQLVKGLLSEDEFQELVRKEGLTSDVFKELTQGGWDDLFLVPELTAYLKAKG